VKPTEDCDEWVVVAQFDGTGMGMAADIAVSHLEGSGVPAIRLPTGATTSTFDSIYPVGPVRVLVPPDQADRAREILAEDDAASAEVSDEG